MWQTYAFYNSVPEYSSGAYVSSDCNKLQRSCNGILKSKAATGVQPAVLYVLAALFPDEMITWPRGSLSHPCPVDALMHLLISSAALSGAAGKQSHCMVRWASVLASMQSLYAAQFPLLHLLLSPSIAARGLLSCWNNPCAVNITQMGTCSHKKSSLPIQGTAHDQGQTNKIDMETNGGGREPWRHH